MDRKFALRGHTHPVLQCLFSPNGLLIASIDDHGEIRIWNSRDGSLLKTIETPAQQNQPQIHFSFDSKFVVGIQCGYAFVFGGGRKSVAACLLA